MLVKRHYYIFLYIFFICVFILTGWSCSSDHKNNSQTGIAADSVHFDHQVHAQYAEGFRISYHKNYKLVEILRPFQNLTDTLRYSLVPRKLAGQIQVQHTTEIPIPVRSLVATSTTHIGLIEMLDAVDVITGMAGGDYIYSKKVNSRLESGEIEHLPRGELNKEKILSMNPDLVMISGGQSSQYDNYQLLMDTGINIMVNSEWLETTPLGKAEWVKVMAALLNREAMANKRFNKVASEYNALKDKVMDIEKRPLVINNMPYKGAWFVSGGDSFTAQYLRDAGADYPWVDNNETGGLRRDFEAVYEVGLTADIWINPGTARTKEDILAKDSRFSEFKAFKTGQIYNNNRRTNSSGGNDYWESGVVHPERILADLIKAFHPGILPDHEFYYYQKVE